MTGDFSRNTFDARRRFSRVLMQQGRVLLDADWNEQTSILLHALRALAADVIGQHGSPDEGFSIAAYDGHPYDFLIAPGRYYVDGILCENLPDEYCAPGDGPAEVRPISFMNQPDYPLDENECKQILGKSGVYLVYLDVWERHLNHLEAPWIREVGLGGPDTATRARVVWQVRATEVDADQTDCDELLGAVVTQERPCLRARAMVPETSEDPCIVPPEARYRGAENQLYRVEIHRGTDPKGRRPATWKWSRDNGSVVLGIRSVDGRTVRLESFGPDDRRGLREGDWVEIVDERSVLAGRRYPLAEVTAVDRVAGTVTLGGGTNDWQPPDERGGRRFLRRWDQGSDAATLQEGTWLDLEDGVQIRFEENEDDEEERYRAGDFWQIPARTATGDVIWPATPDGSPRALPPDGIVHHYAPLARIRVSGGAVEVIGSCRYVFEPLAVSEAEAEPVERGGTEGPVRPDVSVREREIAELRRIMDVGPSRAELLLDSGRSSPEAVAAMSVDEVRTVLRVAEPLARSIRDSARRLAEERD